MRNWMPCSWHTSENATTFWIFPVTSVFAWSPVSCPSSSVITPLYSFNGTIFQPIFSCKTLLKETIDIYFQKCVPVHSWIFDSMLLHFPVQCLTTSVFFEAFPDCEDFSVKGYLTAQSKFPLSAARLVIPSKFLSVGSSPTIALVTSLCIRNVLATTCVVKKRTTTLTLANTRTDAQKSMTRLFIVSSIPCYLRN